MANRLQAASRFWTKRRKGSKVIIMKYLYGIVILFCLVGCSSDGERIGGGVPSFCSDAYAQTSCNSDGSVNSFGCPAECGSANVNCGAFCCSQIGVSGEIWCPCDGTPCTGF